MSSRGNAGVTDPSPPVIVVAGGGLAGMAAAERLLAEGVRAAAEGKMRRRVILVEAQARLGGVIETVRRDGWLVERSADTFLAARPEGLELVERLGLTGSLVTVRESARRALVAHGRRTLPVPVGFRLLAPGSAAGITDSALFSAEGKARILAERDVPRRAASGDESLESFAVRRLGREAFDRLVQPLVAGIWTADPARLSMRAACPEFLRMEEEHGSLSVAEERRLASAGDAHRAEGARYGQFVALAEGLGSLMERFVERLRGDGLEIRRARVAGVERHPGGGFVVAIGTGSGEAAAIRADGVVVALPAPAAATVVAPLDARLAGELSGIEYAGSVVVALGYRREQVAHPLDAAGLVVPRGERRRALAVSFSSSKFPGRAPGGHVLLRVFLGGALDPETMLIDDDAIVAVARDELATLLGADGEPALVEIARWPAAMPQYHLGHVERVARIGGRLDGIPGLALAGAAHEGVGIPQVIASGQAAAGKVMSALEPSQTPDG